MDTALIVSQSLYCFTTSTSHGVENSFPRLWGTVISDAIFFKNVNFMLSLGNQCSASSKIFFLPLIFFWRLYLYVVIFF